MKYKGIIFDLDGVICFTDEYHYLAWKELADSRGIPFDREINNRLRGVSRIESLEIILENSETKYSSEQKLELAERKNTRYRELLINMSTADCSNEVRETLSSLRAAGVKLAIGSSSKNTPTILARIDAGKYFDAVSDGNNITHSKPDPEVFLKAAEMLGLEPSECLIVEDAVSGIEAGERGGFATASVGDAAKNGRGDYLLEKVSDLLKI